MSFFTNIARARAEEEEEEEGEFSSQHNDSVDAFKEPTYIHTTYIHTYIHTYIQHTALIHIRIYVERERRSRRRRKVGSKDPPSVYTMKVTINI
jgi:hypothetical protein